MNVARLLGKLAGAVGAGFGTLRGSVGTPVALALAFGAVAAVGVVSPWP